MNSDCYTVCCAELGEYLAERRIAVVYGGGLFGMMGKMAHGVLDKGGDLTGIIPKFFTGSIRMCSKNRCLVISRF